jgi:hypothetical protein
MGKKLEACPKCGNTDAASFTRWEKFGCTISFGGDEYGESTGDVKEPKTAECFDCGHKISLKKMRGGS